MDGFFIDPSTLPGGRTWQVLCANTHEGTPGTASEHATGISALLHCDTSSVSGFIQVLLLLIVYGGVLFKASELIAYGSELLLLVPSLRGIVGSVVLPILGAVPDGAIVLFSGLGENAQEELSVGVGALAGSTCMLLTLPWFLAILAGRVNIRADGVLTYHHRPNKLTPPNNLSLDQTGVQPLSMVRISGRIMLLTACSYLVIQGAALVSGTFFRVDETHAIVEAAAKAEHWPALICFFVATAFFLWYLYDQVTSTSEEEKDYFETFVDEIKQRAIRNGQISLTAAFQEIWRAASDADESSGLIADDKKKNRLKSLLKTFFNGYDHDKNGSIDRLELANLMRDLGEVVTPDEFREMYSHIDADRNDTIELEEFVEYMPSFMSSHARRRNGEVMTDVVADEPAAANGIDEEGVDDEEDEEVPKDLQHQDPSTQLKNIMKRAFLMMFAGTVLVLVFADPMVSILSDVGNRLGIPPFYISFLLAPLASNASELLAAYSYAKKKTRKTVTISFSTLLGAAIMNNTFVLAIFMLLLTVKQLAWTFTAETISILTVEIFMGIMSQKKVLTLRDGYMVLAMFPLSLAIVAFLENVVGLD